MIYVGRRYTSRVTAAAVKPVRCEKCGRQYSYRVTRQGVGQGSSPYYLDNSGAARRAEDRARASATRKLRDACEIVPCPTCGWIQPDMVAEARRRRNRWMIWLGVCLPLAATLVLGLLLLTANSGEQNTGQMVLVGFLGVGAMGLLPLRYFLNGQYDPNAGHPGAAMGAAMGAAPAGVVAGVAPTAVHTAPAAALPESNWYCSLNGQQTGPLSSHQLRGLIAAGRLRPIDHVWCSGMADWVPAQSVPGLFAI